LFTGFKCSGTDKYVWWTRTQGK